MKEYRSAQVAVEFMIVLSVLLIILLVALDFGYTNNSALRVHEARLSAQQIAFQVASEINAVYLAGNGLLRTVYLASTLHDGTAYNVSVYGASHVVVVSYEKGTPRSSTMPIIAGSINGTTTALNGPLNLTNIQGVIQIG